MKNAAVSILLDNLHHPLRSRIEQLRALILSVNPQIEEQVKWNAPSYSLSGKDFLTIRVQPKNALQLIFHTGAKKSTAPKSKPLLKNSHPLLVWKGTDRAILDLQNTDIFHETEPELSSLVKDWIAMMAKQ